MNMNVPGFRAAALLEFHSKTVKCVRKDDERDSVEIDYGVRQFADWMQLSGAIEADLSTRNVPFTKVPW